MKLTAEPTWSFAFLDIDDLRKFNDAYDKPAIDWVYFQHLPLGC